MKLIYAQGFSKNEKLEWKPVVFSNVVQSFKTIQDAMNELGIGFENPENEVRNLTRQPRPCSLCPVQGAQPESAQEPQAPSMSHTRRKGK